MSTLPDAVAGRQKRASDSAVRRVSANMASMQQFVDDDAGYLNDISLHSKPLTLLVLGGLESSAESPDCGCRNRNRRAMKKNMYRPVLMGLPIAALLMSALAATSYPAHAASSAHAAIGSNTPVPAAPSNLTAQAVGTTSVQLTWTNNASNQSGDVISLDGEQSVDLQGATVSSYTWNGLSPNTKYWFYVASKIYGTPGDPTGYGNTQSAWVGPVYATTAGTQPSTSPANAAVDITCDAAVDITCDAAVDITCDAAVDITCDAAVDITCDAAVDGESWGADDAADPADADVCLRHRARRQLPAAWGWPAGTADLGAHAARLADFTGRRRLRAAGHRNGRRGRRSARRRAGPGVGFRRPHRRPVVARRAGRCRALRRINRKWYVRLTKLMPFSDCGELASYLITSTSPLSQNLDFQPGADLPRSGDVLDSVDLPARDCEHSEPVPAGSGVAADTTK